MGPPMGPMGPGGAPMPSGAEAGPLPEPNMATTGPQVGAEANMPSMPTNPATGQEWNPQNGGGMVPR